MIRTAYNRSNSDGARQGLEENEYSTMIEIPEILIK